MKIQEKIIAEYPLTERIDCELHCYKLAKRRYIIFWKSLVKSTTIEEILKEIEEKTENEKFISFKTLIIVWETDENFKKEDLVYFNGVNTFAVFYLINKKEKAVYKNDSWIYVIGCNYKKYIRKINEIVLKNCCYDV